jgi:D-3-phosphoglycerate dehydrogenase
MNAVAVAELAFGHILNADRRIADNVADLRAGRWRKKFYAGGRGLKGRTLGVIGVGAIGRAVVKRALAFEMDVVAFDPMLDHDAAQALGVERLGAPVEVAARAHVLTVHVALLPATRGFIDAAVFAALEPGAIFVNTSRGEVVDEAALAVAVTEKGVIAGLDVFHGEPPSDGDWESPLAALDGVYGTHHIAASTAQAQGAVAEETCRVILTYRDTGTPPNRVNTPVARPA